MMVDNTIQKLIAEMIDGTISEEDQKVLLERMEQESDVRDLYTEMIQLDSMLRMDYQAGKHEPITFKKESGSKQLKRQLKVTRYLLMSAVVLCMCLIGYQLMTGGSGEVKAGLIQEGEPVAVISRTYGASWKKRNRQPEVGKTIYPGWLDLEKGQATVGMLNGTNLLLSGEVRLGLNAFHRTTLQKGKVSIYTPEGKSVFTLALGWATVETKGSLFEVSEEKEKSLLRVHRGHVRLQLNEGITGDNGEDEIELSENEEVLLSRDGNRIIQKTFSKESSLENQMLSNIQSKVSQEQLKFQKEQIKPFGFQDGQYSLISDYSIEEEGNLLKLEGNVWKAVEINVEINPDSVIEFDFKSEQEGQIHGIGFAETTEYSEECPIFQVYGYENIEHIRKQFHHYEGTDWQHFRIPIGLYLKGHYQYLLLIADEDVMATAQSQFRNVRISSGK